MRPASPFRPGDLRGLVVAKNLSVTSLITSAFWAVRLFSVAFSSWVAACGAFAVRLPRPLIWSVWDCAVFILLSFGQHDHFSIAILLNPYNMESGARQKKHLPLGIVDSVALK
jgi:hypothetical protein